MYIEYARRKRRALRENSRSIIAPTDERSKDKAAASRDLVRSRSEFDMILHAELHHQKATFHPKNLSEFSSSSQRDHSQISSTHIQKAHFHPINFLSKKQSGSHDEMMDNQKHAEPRLLNKTA